jgi:hypothetical protein
MEGLIEGIEGSLAGESRTVSIQFPVRPGGAGIILLNNNISYIYIYIS